jgi:hypothetical protein
MPLTIETATHDPICLLSKWVVDQDDALAAALAWLYAQKQAHAMDIIREFDPGPASFIGREIDNAIDTLRYKISDIAADLVSVDEAITQKALKILGTRVAHRDGLLFQHVSWITARLQYPNAEASAPHVRQADKGFDGFLIEHPAGQLALSKVVLCEDKASVNPRSLVTSQIWPDIKSIIAGERDREIAAAVGALLSNVPPADREAILAATIWTRAKHYRVALAAGNDQRRDGCYLHLFHGYEQQALGDISIRLAEVMPMPEVRVYLAELATKVIAKLEAMKLNV